MLLSENDDHLNIEDIEITKNKHQNENIERNNDGHTKNHEISINYVITRE